MGRSLFGSFDDIEEDELTKWCADQLHARLKAERKCEVTGCSNYHADYCELSFDVEEFKGKPNRRIALCSSCQPFVKSVVESLVSYS